MNASVIKMDIFDLDKKEFEKKIDKLLESVSDDELLQELIECGLKTQEENRKEMKLC